MVTRKLLLLFLTMAFSLVSQHSLATVIASVDRSVVAIDETISLTIRVNKSGSFTRPDLDILERDFHVLGSNQSSRHSIINGKSQSSTEWAVTLMPKRQGQLLIPAITINGEQTQPITINVQASAPRSANAEQPVFIESEVDSETVFVQQQLIFTLRVFQSIQLDSMSVSEPEFDNASVEKLSQTSYQRRLGNTPYRVHEIRYAIFPQQSGTLTIPEMVFTATETVARRSVFNLPGQGRPIRKLTRQHKVSVNNPPAKFSGQTWLPAKSIQLLESWSTSPGNIRVGDSITRTIRTEAVGLLASQLPPQPFIAVPGLKFYPDQGQSENSLLDTGVSSFRADSAAIIPTQEGPVQLPEIRLSWFNTELGTLQEAVIPASTIQVKPALAGAPSAAAPLAVDHSQQRASPPQPAIDAGKLLMWRWISAGLLLLWLLTLSLLLLRIRNTPERNDNKRSSEQTNGNERQAFKQLSKACKGDDVDAIRTSLVAWAKLFWPQQTISSLHDVRHMKGNGALHKALQHIENALYSSHATAQWNGDGLLSVVKLLRDRGGSKQAADALAPLYQS